MPSEIQKFQSDLLESVKQMRRGQAAKVTKVKLPEAAEARTSVDSRSKSSPSSWASQRARCKTGSKAAANPRALQRHFFVLQ